MVVLGPCWNRNVVMTLKGLPPLESQLFNLAAKMNELLEQVQFV